MLFDIVRELNDQITIMVNDGMPGRTKPMLYGMTDGYNVHITFMDQMVWDSTNWKYDTEDESFEMKRIKEHIRARITEHLTSLYNIQF
jgi:hypothetical protein